MGSERRLPTVAVAHLPEALRWMESLADATRLRLLRLLERHELGVAELCDVLQLPQSTVSRHLKVLSDQAWLRSRPQRTTNLYRMDLGELDPAARRLWTLTREQTDDWATVAQDQLRLTRRLAERQPSQGFFAGAAGRWDRLREELYGKTFTQEAFLGLLPAEWIVADLGCGTGQVDGRAGAARAAGGRRGSVRGHAEGGAPADGGAGQRRAEAGEPRGPAPGRRRLRRRAAAAGPDLRRGPGRGAERGRARPSSRGPPRGGGPVAPRPRGIPPRDGPAPSRFRHEGNGNAAGDGRPGRRPGARAGSGSGSQGTGVAVRHGHARSANSKEGT